ncbi:sugar phosphate isomerase/epimerase [Candidatus Woesearchaeota archaeon]|nr:sugar phosphate isomerase/epimerase [Candidatus Woesearchaeota archaeon]
MILTGLAICDLAMDSYALSRISGTSQNDGKAHQFLFDACELQLENWDRYGMFLGQGREFADFVQDDAALKQANTLLTRALLELKSKKFRSFHCPTKSGNISSLDDRVRRQAMSVTMRSMDVAHAFGASVFVLHPCRYDWGYWEQVKDRVHNYMNLRNIGADIFIDNLREIAEYYARKGFAFQVGLENLEFNQFPATVGETFGLLERANDVWTRINPDHPLKAVIDIQHMKHSKTILKENVPNPIEHFIPHHELEALQAYVHLPVCREHDYVPPEGEPYPVINGLFRDHLDDICLVHVGGNNHRHATHDPILYDLRKFSFEKYHYDNGVLNIRQVLDIIHHSGYSGAIILEVMSHRELFDERFEELAESVKNVRNYMEYVSSR